MRFASTLSMTESGRPFSRRDALAQRRLELDLAAHGALGDRGDDGLQPGHVGEFVDAFLADHGRIHVGDDEALAPLGEPLHHDIDGRVANRRLRPGWPRRSLGAGKWTSQASPSASQSARPAPGSAGAASTSLRRAAAAAPPVL